MIRLRPWSGWITLRTLQSPYPRAAVRFFTFFFVLDTQVSTSTQETKKFTFIFFLTAKIKLKLLKSILLQMNILSHTATL